jgi:hypothetical protein
MLKTPRAGQNSEGKNSQGQNSKDKKVLKLTPHPRLFRVVCAIFALWMAALLILYFWTVYPQRHP